MLKLFIPASFGGPLVPFLSTSQEKTKRLFQSIPQEQYEHSFIRSPNIAEADMVALPHEYWVLQKNSQYLRDWVGQARSANKKLLISAYQDDPTPINILHAVILRPSLYKRTHRKNEISMPAYVEDLGVYSSGPLRKGAKPKVGFVGKVDSAGLRYLVKNFLLYSGSRRDGLYYRRRALGSLERDARIELFVIRRSHYSGHQESIELNPIQARQEYIRSIIQNHFTLAPRGDGNYSLRFYETLSLGRIPILIDTDVVLPLEDIIAYDDFILRIPWQELRTLPERLYQFYNSKTDEELVSTQTNAREVFERYLYMPQFLKTILTKERMGL